MSSLASYATVVSTTVGALVIVTRFIVGRLERNRQALQAHLADQDRQLADLRERGTVPLASISHHLDSIDRHLEHQDREVQSLAERLARVEGQLRIED